MALYSDQIIKVNYYMPDRELLPPEASEGYYQCSLNGGMVGTITVQ